MKNIARNTTEVISISLPKPVLNKLEKERKLKGQSRSAFIASLIDQIAEDARWQRVYKIGEETARRMRITSEDDIDRILHEA